MVKLCSVSVSDVQLVDIHVVCCPWMNYKTNKSVGTTIANVGDLVRKKAENLTNIAPKTHQESAIFRIFCDTKIKLCLKT